MRKYTKLKSKINIKQFCDNIESGNFTHKQIIEIYSLSERQLYYLIKKYSIINNLIIDRSYLQTSEFKEKISIANKGKIRTEEHKLHYKEAAAKREILNYVGSGWNHSKETIEKIKQTNKETYSNLPQKWIDSCINNQEWFDKLQESAKNKPPKTKDEIRKTIETKVGMSYDEWQIVRGELESYRARVRQITDLQPLILLYNFEKRGKEYHLDHMFSISAGFKQNVSEEIVGCIINLAIIPATENCIKNKKCSITLPELMEKYNEHITRKL